jgi:tRNA (cmo5U34)-methyltransferase
MKNDKPYVQKFDFDTIENFDEHILKSIPNYDVLFGSIKSISEYFYVDGSNIYDLGCSTGKLLKSINGNYNKIGYDIATLLPKEDGFFPIDLNENFPIENACIVYSIFTMQFLNPNNRKKYLQQIYDGLDDGGALIICEKVYQEFGKVQEIISFSHYDYKLNHFTSDEIISKERDLRFIMKPCNNNELTELIKSVGFDIVTDFWQMFNFKGIIAIK